MRVDLPSNFPKVVRGNLLPTMERISKMTLELSKVLRCTARDHKLLHLLTKPRTYKAWLIVTPT